MLGRSDCTLTTKALFPVEGSACLGAGRTVQTESELPSSAFGDVLWSFPPSSFFQVRSDSRLGTTGNHFFVM